MLGGGGIDYAIHKAAGPKLKEYCKTLNGCNEGYAKITEGFNLKAKHIIHAVGPQYNSSKNPNLSLYNAYKNCLILADEYKIGSICFCCISCGVFRFPMQLASKIAFKSCLEYFQNNKSQIKFVIFCIYKGGGRREYLQLLKVIFF